ncbi:MAG: OmpP1/FadL family transporter [Flavobacteriaceae bacterium]
MKKSLIIFILFLSSTAGQSQVLGYTDLAVLFSERNLKGTARFNAMGGAFGALGGDLSAMEVNPAAAGVFKASELGFSVSYNTNDISSSYYGNTNMNYNYKTDFEQAGMVSVTNIGGYGDDFAKLVFGFNYTKTANYNNYWLADGNSGIATWVDDPTDPNIQYTEAEYQFFDSYTEGGKHQYSFFLGGQMGKQLYLGAGLKTQSLDFYQSTTQEEYNNDGNNDYVDGYIEQWQDLNGAGVSLNFGVIMKVNQALRLGVAYETPTWWNMTEESNLFSEDEYDMPGYYEVYYSTDPDYLYHNDYGKVQFYDYKLNTPGQLTASGALVVKKAGLISFDYRLVTYNQLQYPYRGFNNENIYLRQNLQNTSNFSVGTEWRFGPMSLRGGYRYEMSPYKDALEDENTEEISMGIGFSSKHFKFDLAYQFYTRYSNYSFYPDYPEVDPAVLQQDFSKFTTSFLVRL